MWIPKSVVSWLDVSLTTVNALKERVAVLETQNATLERELTASRINNDWFRVKINDLEATNKALLEKAYDIRLPVPQILRATPPVNNPYKLPEALFEHIDDDTAKQLGL